MSQTNVENISTIMHHRESQNIEETQKSSIKALLLADGLHSSSNSAPRKKKKDEQKTAVFDDFPTTSRTNTHCPTKKWKQVWTIFRSKKKRCTLRFNEFSRMRIFENGEQLQTRYPECLLSTFPPLVMANQTKT